MSWLAAERPVLRMVSLLIGGSMLAAGMAPARADEAPPEYPYCGERTFADCERLPGYGTPARVEGVETILPIRDTPEARALYKKLIGPRFEMPENPRIRFRMNDIRLGHAVPVVQDMGPTKYDQRYIEFNIGLLVHYGPHLGWRGIRLPLNNVAGFEAGRAIRLPKFLADMVYEQDPSVVAGYATAREGGRFFMRADWEVAPDLELGVDYADPTRYSLGDDTEDGSDWNRRVEHGAITWTPGAPVEWATGIDLPLDNPTRPTFPSTAVRVRIRITDDIDQFNVAPPGRRSILNSRPLGNLFDESESLGMLIDLDQEAPGRQYGPSHGILLSESSDVTDDGPCREPPNCE